MGQFVRFRTRWHVVVAAILISVASAAAADKQSTYCWSASLRSGSNIQFFSKVFLADTSDWKEWQHMEVAFQKYIDRSYQDSNPGPGECRHYSSKETAEQSLDIYERGARGDGGQAVETGWTYSQIRRTTFVQGTMPHMTCHMAVL